MPEPSDLKEQLRILAQLQQRLMYMAGGEVRQEPSKSKRKELKGQIAVQRKKVEELVSVTLWPLFSCKAALYLATPERVAVLDRMLLPNPPRESIQDDGRDWEQVLHAVRSLFTSRAHKRVFGAVSAFPGWGRPTCFGGCSTPKASPLLPHLAFLLHLLPLLRQRPPLLPLQPLPHPQPLPLQSRLMTRPCCPGGGPCQCLSSLSTTHDGVF